MDDEFLNLPAAHLALVNGSQQKLIESINTVGLAGALAAREYFPGGSTGIDGTGNDPIVQAGNLPSNLLGGHWQKAQQARWIAEDAVARFTSGAAGTVNPGTLTLAYLWAGYANRLLGENYCEAVFNGGPIEPNSKYFERAQSQFTTAIASGTGAARTAAYAGRASVRVWLKDWAGAVSDAQQVPRDFAYSADAEGPDRATLNVLFWANSNLPWKTVTVWGTWSHTYYEQTGDPRTPWKRDAAVPFANNSLSGFGPVPFLFGLKYKTTNDNFRLSSGREMMLIRAEGLLEAGQWQDAMVLINANRTAFISDLTGRPLSPWVASNITEAWTLLKRERGIELWLEARRLGDIRRWAQNKTPGVLDWPDFESRSVLFRTYPPSQCFPIPDSERDVNPNF